MGFNNRSREIYFKSYSISLSQNGKEREYRCVLYSNQSGELKFETSYSFTWTDTDTGFTMKLADKTIYTSKDKFTAMQYFFVEQGAETYRFSCRKCSYQKRLKADYALFYEVKTAHLFKGKK